MTIGGSRMLFASLVLPTISLSFVMLKAGGE